MTGRINLVSLQTIFWINVGTLETWTLSLLTTVDGTRLIIVIIIRYYILGTYRYRSALECVQCDVIDNTYSL